MCVRVLEGGCTSYYPLLKNLRLCLSGSLQADVEAFLFVIGFPSVGFVGYGVARTVESRREFPTNNPFFVRLTVLTAVSGGPTDTAGRQRLRCLAFSVSLWTAAAAKIASLCRCVHRQVELRARALLRKLPVSTDGFKQNRQLDAQTLEILQVRVRVGCLCHQNAVCVARLGRRWRTFTHKRCRRTRRMSGCTCSSHSTCGTTALTNTLNCSTSAVQM